MLIINADAAKPINADINDDEKKLGDDGKFDDAVLTAKIIPLFLPLFVFVSMKSA